MDLTHPIELLLADQARNAESIVQWCAMTTGVVPSDAGRNAALGLLRSQRLEKPTLRYLAKAWADVQDLDAVVYEIEHVAAPLVDQWYRERTEVGQKTKY